MAACPRYFGQALYGNEEVPSPPASYPIINLPD
jgi:hypothetical protein